MLTSFERVLVIRSSLPALMDPITIDTPLATIKRMGAELVEIRLKPEEVMTLQRIRDLFGPLDAHGLTAPSRLLVVLPAEGVRFQLNVMYRDHFADRPAQRAGHAFALVAPNRVDRQLVQLYFKHFPSPQKSRVFSTEAEARLWLWAV